jgi:iron complex outermembrane receptor protein
VAKLYLVLLTVFFAAQVSLAQSAFKVVIKDDATKEPIAGVTVTVKDTEISATTDAQGVAQLTNIPDGQQILTIFSPGYESQELKFTFPRTEQNETVIFIRVTNEVGEVTVTSTRTGREIDDVPSRSDRRGGS